MSQITPKERMLKKIRKALLTKVPNPYANLEEKPFYFNGGEDQPEIMFAEQFTLAAGQFVFCEDEVQLIENLLSLAEERKWRRIYCWEPALQNLLEQYEYPYYATDKDLNLAEAGLTLCEALVARNGSILVSNGGAAGRRLSIYPPVHVVVAYTSQIVLDIKDGLDVVKKKYGQALPSMLSLITGPSRTADIEKTLVLGAHGPKEVFVFLLDGASSQPFSEGEGLSYDLT